LEAVLGLSLENLNRRRNGQTQAKLNPGFCKQWVLREGPSLTKKAKLLEKLIKLLEKAKTTVF
jgi:hypothetical protein